MSEDKKTLEEAEVFLRASIDARRARGWRLQRGMSRDWETCGCALVALPPIPGGDPMAGKLTSRAEHHLGWSLGETWAFISGFDGVDTFLQDDAAAVAHRDLGRRLAECYLEAS